MTAETQERMDRSRQLGEEKVSKLLLTFSIPAITGMMVNALYNIVDRIFIGNGVGSLGIAGITIGFPIMLVGMAFGMLFGFGATSLISIKLGERKKEEAERILGNGTALLIISSIILTVLGLVYLDPLLQLCGASETVLPYAREYVRIILLGTVFASLGFGMNNFIRAEGNPKMAMLTMIIGAVLNIILDPIFIFVFGWGLQGAAWATVISQMVSGAWVLYYFLSKKSSLDLRWPNLRLHAGFVGRIMAVGAAPFAMHLAASLLNVIMNKSLTFYGGDVAVAGMGIIHSVATMILMPIFGLNQGAQPIIGFNYGAGNFTRVKEALRLAVLAATVVVCIGFVAIEVWPAQLIALFNARDKELIDFGAYALRVFLIALPVIGFQVVGSSYFQAVGKPRQAMILTLSRQVLILIPLLLVLPRFYGLDGILYAGPISDVGATILTALWLGMEFRGQGSKNGISLQMDEVVSRGNGC